MAQLAIAAAGAALGGWIAPGAVAGALGMTGAQLGWMAGSLVGSAFTPTQKSQGPRLGDLTVTTSAYGTPIPYLAGSPRIAGQIVWASTKREIATTQSAGGKGGGGSEYTSYSYEVDLLILLSSNEIPGVKRIWSNGELVSGATNKDGLFDRLTVYGGGSSQLPDPDYEAAVGTLNAPAYRGRGTVFIKSLQLGSSGQIPNLTFQIGTPSGPLSYVHLVTGFAESSSEDMSLYNLGAGSRAAGILTEGNYYLNFLNDQNNYIAWSNNTVLRRASGGAMVFEMIFNHVPGVNYSGYVWLFQINDGWGNTMLRGGVDGTAQHYFMLEGFYDGAANSLYYSHPTTSRTGANIHIAICFHNNSQCSLYYNGIRMKDHLSFNPTTLDTSMIRIGGFSSTLVNAQFNIKGVRVSMADIYTTASFTPPTALDLQSIYVLGNDTPITLPTLVNNLVTTTGLIASKFTTSALSSSILVRSMAISQVSTIRTILEMLAQTYYFDCVLKDKLYFVPRASASSATLTFDEFGIEEGISSTIDPLPLILANNMELAMQMAITYINVDNDYLTDTQYSERLLEII